MRRWLTWVVLGVVWGLLCVGTRHLTLNAGRDVQELVAERQQQLSLVQALERQVADARQLGNLELLAARQGFVRPLSSQMIIVAPEEGLLSRLLGGGNAGSGGPAGAGLVTIRSRDEVVVEEASPRKAKRRRRR